MPPAFIVPRSPFNVHRSPFNVLRSSIDNANSSHPAGRKLRLRCPRLFAVGIVDASGIHRSTFSQASTHASALHVRLQYNGGADFINKFLVAAGHLAYA